MNKLRTMTCVGLLASVLFALALPVFAGTAVGATSTHAILKFSGNTAELIIPTPACPTGSPTCQWELYVNEPDTPGTPTVGSVIGSSGTLVVALPTTFCGVVQADALLRLTPTSPFVAQKGIRKTLDGCTTADVSVVKTAPNPNITAGQTAEFVITETSNGPATADDVTLSDPLPPGYTWSQDNAHCSISAGTLSCAFGNQAPGVQQVIHLTAPTSAAACGAIPNTATVGAANDSNPNNNKSSATIYCTVPPKQTIAGHIYLCSNGSQTTTEVPGGTLGATGPQVVATEPNPLNPLDVAAGGYTMNATSPSAYQFVACGGTAHITSSSTANEPVTVPTGGAGVGIFYVTPITQTIAGHIYLCSNGSPTTTEVPAGTLGATGPQTVATQANPLNPVDVAAGGYTMNATSPSGYLFVACGGSANITSSSTANESVTVPSGGAGVGIFYVTQITQTIAGHIYLCSNGSQTTTEVAGGTLGATGPQTVATQPNPLNPVDVAAGGYTMDATSPTGYQFIACGGSANITSSSAANESVTVPSGGAGVGIFYVTQITQTIAGHIYSCSNGTPTTTEVSGGTLGATGPQTVATQANPLNPVDVAAGGYTMNATAPSGYMFVTCGGNATITSSSTANEPVTVPSGGAGVGIFYVTPITQTIAGHIYSCTNGSPTTEVPGGTLGATGPQTVATQANPLNPVDVAAGGYTMSASAPSGYQFVACGGSATINNPTSATESVTVPTGGAGVGIFYVTSTPPPTCPSNSIVSNFNGTSIPGNSYIWFNSVTKVSGASNGGTIQLTNSFVTFSANGTNYNLPVPDAAITFSTTAAKGSTTFNGSEWVTTVPASFGDNVFLSGLSFPVPAAGLPGGISPVTWTGDFTLSSGLSLSWQWAAAVYTTFTTSYNSLDVKPLHSTNLDNYPTGDQAGTPEAYTNSSYLPGGARGGGGSNWTGSYTGTGNCP